MKPIFVSGADGFLGTHLCRQLTAAGYSVRAGVRHAAKAAHLHQLPVQLESVVALGDLGTQALPPDALHGCDAVIHLAARVHVMRETALDPIAAFRRVNVHGTERLAQAAVSAGLRRFVFVSSIKVNGEATLGQAFSETTTPQPCDPYGVSKREAEESLTRLAQASGMQVTIVRPPLVYGPGVGGNLYRLMQHLYKRLPVLLPPGENQRSLVSVHNLADFLIRCLTHPQASNQTFLLSDGRDLSTRQLIQILASSLRRQSLLITVPQLLIRAGSLAAPVRQRLQRLAGSLQIDSTKARTFLGWTPPFRPEEALAGTADWFVQQTR